MSSSNKLRFSRWRRLPGVFRTGDHPRADADDGTRRLTLYVTWRLLDQAELLAKHAGAPSIQHYCEALLQKAIDHELDQLKIHQSIQHADSPLEGLAQIASDPDYLREWTEIQTMDELLDTEDTPPIDTDNPHPPVEIPISIDPIPQPALEDQTQHLAPESTETPPHYPASDPLHVVLHHAGMITYLPQPGLLERLRRGEPLRQDSLPDLTSALLWLEQQHADRLSIDRRLAYALHRLAFEGQILVSDAWPELAIDPDTIATLRAIQEQVDRILSGQDIRYHEPAPPISFS